MEALCGRDCEEMALDRERVGQKQKRPAGQCRREVGNVGRAAAHNPNERAHVVKCRYTVNHAFTRVRLPPIWAERSILRLHYRFNPVGRFSRRGPLRRLPSKGSTDVRTISHGASPQPTGKAAVRRL